MSVPPAVGVLAQVAELLLEEPADRGGALWRLSAEGRQLDANVIRMLPGSRVSGHVDPDLDVFLCVLGGTGRLEVDGGGQPLETGCVVWLPRGTRRALLADQDGLVYVTVHRRRPGLAIRSAAEAEGGEAACLLDRVCPGCDRPAQEAGARYCSRCGTQLPS
ncbi:cupin domain [Streptomyces sp. SLBN-118]|uniref:cupin domain-containing protein n=1 Tax=Streptomyces sp. SLBN-118 TaxID=2768454 RepID=UPI001153E9F4|nr:cupin domain-containing protein [Streptomyces sp. SLBN-118]TQK51233.1 cupin domain [Streptomyces sp. SLBN-118]